MRPRDAVFLGLGALAYPAGKLIAHLIVRTPLLYPQEIR